MKLWMQEDNEIPREGSFAGENEELIREAAAACLEAEGLCPPATEDLAVSLSFVSEDEIRNLNAHFRKVDRATDVLSFPMMNGVEEIIAAVERYEGEKLTDGFESEIPLGDVVICTDMIKKQAVEYGHSERRELIYLFVHSMLHLLGYDHEDERERSLMRAREDEIMEKLGISR